MTVVFSAVVFGQADEISIVPKPKSIRPADGEFVINKQTILVAHANPDRKMAGVLNSSLKTSLFTEGASIGSARVRVNSVG